jgi:hypothetical protein
VIKALIFILKIVNLKTFKNGKPSKTATNVKHSYAENELEFRPL